MKDQGGPRMLAEIREQFGEPVAEIVLACSDALEEPTQPWRERKEAYLHHLEHQPAPVPRVSLTDKLFNARAILRDYLDVGETTLVYADFAPDPAQGAAFAERGFEQPTATTAAAPLPWRPSDPRRGRD